MNNANEMMVQAATIGVNGLAGFNGGTSLSGASWLNSQSKVVSCSCSANLCTDFQQLEQLHELRVMALGNAKMLYGSEKFKYYGSTTLPIWHTPVLTVRQML